MNTFVIAEAGANHDKNFNKAIQLIDVAKLSGATAVKFQTYSSKSLYSKNTPDFAGYKNINKLIKDIELPREWQRDLKQYCDESEIEFMSTPFDEQAIDELYDLGVKRFKIAGFEARDPRLVKYAAKTGLPLIISAGIGVDLVTIQKIIDWVAEENTNPDITFLHCNNAYPTPFEDSCLLQIKRIKNMKYTHEIKVGFSDHTTGIIVPPLAVAIGATTVEKHFTLDRTLPGPDHAFAIEPDELIQMVKNIKITEECLKEKIGLTDSEKKFTKAMRSVVLKKDMKSGEYFSVENITTKRPSISGSVSSMEFFNLIKDGCYIKTDKKEDDILLWEDIGA
jgi:N,N'-diacetyllegionaminate synthase